MRAIAGLVLAMVVALSAPAGAVADEITAAPDGSGRIATHYCSGTLHFFGSPYGYISRGASCHFARYWSKRYQRHGLEPAHWNCTGNDEFTEGGTCWDSRSKKSFEYYIED